MGLKKTRAFFSDSPHHIDAIHQMMGVVILPDILDLYGVHSRGARGDGSDCGN